MKTFLLVLSLFSTMSFAASKNPVVEMKTSLGKIEIELYPDKAPTTVRNFLKYVDDKFYDGLIFHRVIATFMIQGGGFDSKMAEKKTRESIRNEADNGLKNTIGTIAMARTSDPQSATAQFFINVADNAFLNYTAPTNEGYGYAVFGKVISGMHVVERIKVVKTGNVNGMGDVPMDAVTIESIRKK